MHEFGIMQEMLATILEHAAGRRVRRVVLQIGALACVVPEAMRFSFDAGKTGTLAESAELEIQHQPGRGRCRSCGIEFELTDPLALCACGSASIKWLSGQELRITEMEVD